MFIETECVEPNVLLAHRRPRSPEDATVWAAHVLVGATDKVQYETNRERFLGRGNTPAAPAGLRRDLSGSVGPVLDPIFSLRCRAVIEVPHDAHLATGGRIELGRLKPATSDAFLELAALGASRSRVG